MRVESIDDVAQRERAALQDGACQVGPVVVKAEAGEAIRASGRSSGAPSAPDSVGRNSAPSLPGGASAAVREHLALRHGLRSGPPARAASRDEARVLDQEHLRHRVGVRLHQARVVEHDLRRGDRDGLGRAGHVDHYAGRDGAGAERRAVLVAGADRDAAASRQAEAPRRLRA